MPRGAGVRKWTKRRSFTTVSHDLNRTTSLAHPGSNGALSIPGCPRNRGIYCLLLVACCLSTQSCRTRLDRRFGMVTRSMPCLHRLLYLIFPGGGGGGAKGQGREFSSAPVIGHFG